MTLFDSTSQYREKATIWRVFSLSPLYAALAAGHPWRWFAINIPMDLGTGGEFNSDIDIIARLRDIPPSNKWTYRTWEVKVSLLCKDGTARSLKSGKIERTIKQLRAYRDFGSPDVSLLDIYLCEAGFMGHNVFPTPPVEYAITAKIAELREERFGYQLFVFEHDKDGDVDVGLRVLRPDTMNPLQTTFHVLPAFPFRPRDPFAHLVHRIDQFFEQIPDSSRNYIKNQIVFCRNCHRLQYISMRDGYTCPSCQSNLIVQS
jgi:hypothetical protein